MKFKLVVSTTKEFETELTDYPDDCKTPEDARKYEEMTAKDDPFLSMEGGDCDIKVELVEE